eukprot:2482889-Rhodomonas_salina.1
MESYEPVTWNPCCLAGLDPVPPVASGPRLRQQDISTGEDLRHVVENLHHRSSTPHTKAGQGIMTGASPSVLFTLLLASLAHGTGGVYGNVQGPDHITYSRPSSAEFPCTERCPRDVLSRKSFVNLHPREVSLRLRGGTSVDEQNGFEPEVDDNVDPMEQ